MDTVYGLENLETISARTCGLHMYCKRLHPQHPTEKKGIPNISAGAELGKDIADTTRM